MPARPADALAQCVTERGNRAHRIHNLVGKHAYQLAPGLLLILLAAAVHHPLDAVQSLVEAAFVPETEIVFPILERIQHILQLPAVLHTDI